MFGSMNVIRRELYRVVDQSYPNQTERLQQTRDAVGRILDLELAIMLHTYREDMEAQQARKERLAAFGQLVGSIGHELRNPLGVIESSMYLIGQRAGKRRAGQETRRPRRRAAARGQRHRLGAARHDP
jgi:signal transduction histidine kinase